MFICKIALKFTFFVCFLFVFFLFASGLEPVIFLLFTLH